MKLIYVYIMDNMAEWELADILQAFSMQSQLSQSKVAFKVVTVGATTDPITTLGGLTILPEITVSDMSEDKVVALLLPGGDNWAMETNQPILDKAELYLSKNILVGAICGATLALSNRGILNQYHHTSNSSYYLKMFSSNYSGEALYHNTNSYCDKNLITANSASGLDFAKDIITALQVYPQDVIEAWYQYFKVGNPELFSDLMNTANQ